MSIIYTILILGLIVFFHEFGHYIVAKKNGIHVVEFSIGFGPNIVTKVYKGTRYSLKWIPFGGACQMLGDEYGVVDSEVDGVSSEVKEVDQRTFDAKPVWVRIAVLFAGPFFNFVLAFILAIIVLGTAGVDVPRVNQIMEGLPAEAAGLQPGDVLISYDSVRIRTVRDITLFMQENYKDGSIEVVYERDGERMTAMLTPQWSEENQSKLVGVVFAGREEVSAWELLGYSANEVFFWIKLTVQSIGMMFTGDATVNDLSGPVGIVGVVDDTVQDTQEMGIATVLLNLANLGILFSANLGVMNLLPIPALDGGRLLFCLIEVVRGKPVSKEKEMYVTLAGVLFLFALMIFVLFNDVKKLFM